MERILLVMKAETPEECCIALQSAFENATDKKRISYGLLTPLEAVGETAAFLNQLGSVKTRPAGNRTSVDVAALWQGEDEVLLITPDAEFSRGWDT